MAAANKKYTNLIVIDSGDEWVVCDSFDKERLQGYGKSSFSLVKVEEIVFGMNVNREWWLKYHRDERSSQLYKRILFNKFEKSNDISEKTMLQDSILSEDLKIQKLKDKQKNLNGSI